jgi:hypothetical protein
MSVRPSVRPHFIRVRTVTLSYIEGFLNNLAQMSTTSRRCVTSQEPRPMSHYHFEVSYYRNKSK